MSDSQSQLPGLIARLGATTEAKARCDLLCRLSDLVGEYDLGQSLNHAREGLEIARDHGLRHEEARCRLEIGRTLRLLARQAEARDMIWDLAEVFEEFGDGERAGLVHRTLSAIYLDLGLFEEALEHNQKALLIFDQIGQQEYYGMALLDSAFVMRKRHDFDEALAILKSVDARLGKLPDSAAIRYRRMILLYDTALTLLDAGNDLEVTNVVVAAIELCRELGNTSIETACHGIAALAHARLGQFDESNNCIQRCCAGTDKVEAPYDLIVALLNCGRAALAQGAMARASDYIQSALQRAEDTNLRELRADCHAEMSRICESTGDDAGALVHHKAFYALDKEIGHARLEHRIGRMQLQVRIDQAKLEALEKSQKELEKIVSERTRELRIAKDQSESANRSKSEFLAQMSHELRTPLNAIIGFADVIQQELYGRIGSVKYKEYVSDIHDSGNLLLSLIDDILDLSKIEAGKRELDRESCAMAELLEACDRLVKDRASQAGVRLTYGNVAALPAIWVDKRAIKQIFLNLVTNAIKFTPHGGRVEIDASVNDGNLLILTIRDSGIGIAPADLLRVLEPFGQVRNAYTRNKTGSGLGLPLVKSLAELHGGNLSIESKVGEGTKVTVLIDAGNRHLVKATADKTPGHRRIASR